MESPNCLNLSALTNDVTKLVNDIKSPNNLIDIDCIDDSVLICFGNKSYVNIKPPTTYSKILADMSCFDTLTKFTCMNNESIVSYFKAILRLNENTTEDCLRSTIDDKIHSECDLHNSNDSSNNSNNSNNSNDSSSDSPNEDSELYSINKDIIVTNLLINATLTPFGGTYLHHTKSAKPCKHCDCLTNFYFDYICKDCNNIHIDNVDTICCECFLDKKKLSCHVNNDHENVMYIESLYPTINLMCDLCKKNDVFDEYIISSKTYDIDLCQNCYLTEEGIQLIKKYDMLPYRYGFMVFNYNFGSVLDWVPIYKDDQNGYVTICLNKTNVMYQSIAIAYRNIRGDYEYTIVCKGLDKINEAIKKICSDSIILSLRKIAQNICLQEAPNMNVTYNSWKNEPKNIIIYNSRKSIV